MGLGQRLVRRLGGLRRKQFFFEKKNQKTFVTLSYAPARPHTQIRKSPLVLFFRKEHPSLPL
jgi:hypothetical protein